ncbi:MAG: hypothetical protein GEU78_16670 [Actinobacteria bacterium]|nr:hypothetical protein [Actinomycetota bacterium]
MARDRMDLTSFVGKLLKEDDGDILRDEVRSLAQMIMDVEVSSKIGAAPNGRWPTVAISASSRCAGSISS